MAEETPDTTNPSFPDDPGASPPDSTEPALSPSSSSRLNAQAPEYVPRTGNHGRGGRHQGHHHYQHHQQQHHHHHHQQRAPPRMMQIHHHHHHHHRGPPPPTPPVIHMFPQHGAGFHAPPPGAAQSHHGYGGGGAGFVEHEGGGHVLNEFDGGTGPGLGDSEEHFGVGAAAEGGLSEDVVHKVTKQVEYYFSDINLATTEHLMRFISRDPEGFVPIFVISSFKKIKALVNNNAQLATALRTSRKLVVSDDGKKVRRQQSITDSDLEELQSRIVVAENLPEDHCYQSLIKVFSVVGCVKTIRTCYPQTPNGAAPVNPRPGKMDTYLFNRLHAFVEYETAEQAERAVGELNAEGNWRSGLRVRLLPSCMKHGQSRGRKAGYEGDGNFEDDDVSSSKQPNEKQPEDHFQPNDVSQEEMGEEGYHEKEGVTRRGRGRGRGGRGRGRGQHHNNNRGGSHPMGTPPGHSVQIEQHATTKPPGPRMPDGTRGFTMGRGKPLESTGTTS